MAYLWLLLLLLLHKVSCLLLWLWPWHHHVVGLHWPGNPLLLLPGLSGIIVFLFYHPDRNLLWPGLLCLVLDAR